jgi:molecular chaperone GrpE
MNENPEVEPDPVTGDAGPVSEEEMQLAADIDALQRWEQERTELLDTTRRLQADFENYRKRVLREQTALVERATEGLIEQLLPVLDSFELAVGSFDEADESKVRKGVELVYAEFFAVMEKAGLERIDALGTRFDPNEHEAVMQDDGDGDPVVGDVLRTGWKLKGRVLRPAMVKVTQE